MKFIKAITYCYGTPKGHLVHINPNYIISIQHLNEVKDYYGVVIEEECYCIDVNYAREVKRFYVSLEEGNKILGELEK